MKNFKKNIIILVFIFFNLFCFAKDLTITINDLQLIPQFSSEKKLEGFHLYIKKKPDINSVLLTETTKDPNKTESNYAFRAIEWNNINGDEIRMLNGKKLVSEYAKFSIIDSTPEKHSIFKEAFHLFIPVKMVYGYPWTRNGTIVIKRGTFINIRSFGAKYGDYTASFLDNPFMFDLGTPTDEKNYPSESYNIVAVESFNQIAENTGGRFIFSKGPETIINDIKKSLDCLDKEKSVDIVFALDTTGSMRDDVEQLRKDFIPILTDFMEKNTGNVRIGLLLYRDYADNYRYKGLPVKVFDFTQSINDFQKNLNNFYIYGTEGGDTPEAVYEALYASIEFYEWNNNSQKKIILIGDAEPHPKPRATKKYTKDFVFALALSKDILIDAIITPDK